MNLLNIRTFLYIVRYQNISSAAQAMYTSQPTISSRLSQLEEELGVQLVLRRKGHRAIELTQKGQDFIPIAERWLELDRQTTQFCQEAVRASLTIAAPGSYQEYVLPQIIHRLMDCPVPPEIRLRTVGSPQVYTMVADRGADAGLAARLIVSDATVATPVFSTEYVILCPADTCLPDRKISPTELDPHYEVSVTSWTGETRRWHDAHWDPYTPVYLQVDNNHITHSYLTRPENWAVCPASIAIAIRDREPGALTIRRLSADAPRHTCYLVLQRSQLKDRTEIVQRLLRNILEYAEESYLLQPIYNGLPG